MDLVMGMPQSGERSGAWPLERQAGAQVHEPRANITADEENRRRKGKGVLLGEAGDPLVEPWVVPRADPVEPSPLDSGSGSCDPNVEGAQQQVDPLSSEDADSKVGQDMELGQAMESPIVISEGSQEDQDLGGEGGLGVRVASVEGGLLKRMESFEGGQVKMEERAPIKPVNDSKAGGVATQKASSAAESKRLGESRERPRGTDASKGSSLSVPPGFLRRQRSTSGVASPFGKMQKGGLRFLKRPVAAASSAAKQTSLAPSKRNKPIAAMSNKEIAEVASNVGVAEALGLEQIDKIKALEKDPASS